MNTSVIVRDRSILNGVPVFAGTRVPVRILFEYLEAGDRIDEFLDDYPGVTKDQTTAVLEMASDLLIAPHVEAAA